MSRTKRSLDIRASAVGLVLLSPLLIAIVFLIWLDDHRTPFFRQERIGLEGRPFRIWKFRTMCIEAPSLGKPLTVDGDPRITRVGSLLRRTKMDELPQLFNVLSGEMSLVGPRPEVQKYVDLYTEEQRKVLTLVPGITDPASLAFRHESEVLAGKDNPERFYIEELMPEKIRINLDYHSTASSMNDLKIILKTLWAVLT